MKTLAISAVALRKLLRDRTGLFFVLLLPVIITALIGFAIFRAGGDGLKVAILNQGSGPLAAGLVEALDGSPALDVTTFTSKGALERAVRRDEVRAGIEIPAGYDDDLMAGRPVEITFMPSPRAGSPQAIQGQLSAILAEQGAMMRAAVFAAGLGSGSIEENLARAREVALMQTGEVTVSSEIVGRDATPRQFQGFNYPAASNLILFVFITSLTAGAAQMVEARQLGISKRMLASPTSPRQVIVGMTLGRFAIALFQGLFVFTAGALLFGVRWGDPLGAAALILGFCLVATGAAMLFGSVLRTPEQSSLGVPLGIGMGMLGGTMWPLEIVSPAMRTIGHATPHAWAMDGFIALIGRGAGIGEIVREISVLLLFAAVLVTLAIRRFRRSLVG